ncbi:Zn-ribbon domain-containing OB-fold protein [Rhodococcus wratislaviensis]|uniref:Zn-ribbon domain-containing OB-fold protein n=1 Tax=Rhodococcus wratislaviensis TaxID=44752 RepID=UPI003647C768
MNVAPHVLSGHARVVSFTVNCQQWSPGQSPYIVARVELTDQAGLRLDTNLVKIDGDDVVLGMEVEVVFEEGPDGIWFPLFAPVGSR